MELDSAGTRVLSRVFDATRPRGDVTHKIQVRRNRDEGAQCGVPFGREESGGEDGWGSLWGSFGRSGVTTPEEVGESCEGRGIV